jgi:hypothetical protein
LRRYSQEKKLPINSEESSRKIETAVDSPSSWTNLTRWLSNLVPVTISESMKGSITAEIAIAMAMRWSARESLMAKPIEVVDVSSVNARTKTRKEIPNIMGVTRSFGKNPNKLIKANNTYTLISGIDVVNQQAITCFQYPRVVLEDDDSVEVKEFKFPLVWLTGR